jgi:predicted transcriptional regulator
MMNVIVILLLLKLFELVHKFNRGDIVKEEHDDMVVWKIKTKKPTSTAIKLSTEASDEKERKQKEELVQILKILLKEGDKGVLMQTIADRMETNTTKAKHTISKLVDKKMVDEVVGVSGIKYYLTQLGRDYCLRKSK